MTAIKTTSPTDTTVHGPQGDYTVIYRSGKRLTDISVISARSTGVPFPSVPGAFKAGVSISGRNAATNDTFRRIIEIAGNREVTEILGFLNPEGETVWLTSM